MFMNNLYNIYNKGDYREILNYFYNYRQINDYDSLYLGLVLFEIGYFEESIKYFTIANYEKYPDDILKKAKILISLYHYSKGDYTKSYEYLKNQDKEENEWMNLLDLNNKFNIYELEKTDKNILRFHIDPKISYVDSVKFMEDYINVFKEINIFFNPIFRKKIDIFVYNNNVDVLSNNLSYSNNFLNTIHTNLQNECGHELAHLAVASLQKSKKRINKFINEGIAEVFNKTNYYHKYNSKNINSIINLCDLPENYYNLYDKLFMRVGKIFFSFLYKYGTKEQFIYISANQSKEDLLETYDDLAREAEKFTLDIIKKEFNRGCYENYRRLF